MQHQVYIGVQYLTQGHFDVSTAVAGYQTTDLVITGMTTVPPVLQPLNHSSSDFDFHSYQSKETTLCDQHSDVLM